MLMRFSLYALGLLVAMLILFLSIANHQQTSDYHGAKSDHFDGNRFFNAPPYTNHSFLDVLRWALTRHHAPWPAYIHDNKTPELSLARPHQLKITYVNHSTFLIQTEQMNFLTDPNWAERASPFNWIGPKRVRAPGIAFDDLPRIDMILLSHNHYDHLNLETLKKLSDRFHPVIIVPLGIKLLLNRHGINNVVELDWWQTYATRFATVTFLPTQHWSQRGFTDKFKTLWGSYGVEVGHKKIFFGGDAGYSSHFTTIREKWGQPYLALLPIGSYQPEWFMEQNHMNPDEAIRAHQDLNATHSVGMHFGTFQLSDEAIDQPLIDLESAKHAQKIHEEAFLVLKNGETRVFS